MKQLKDKEIQHALEVYCYESLFWGLANPDSFKTYYSTNEKRQRERQAGFRQRKNNFKLTVL